MVNGFDVMREAAIGLGLDVRDTKPRGLICRCPVHGDTKPSLAINEGDGGIVLFRCMSAGCEAGDIIAALGVKWCDILPDRPLLDHSKRRSATKFELTPSEALIASQYFDAVIGIFAGIVQRGETTTVEGFATLQAALDGKRKIFSYVNELMRIMPAEKHLARLDSALAKVSGM